jgi:hypothetical protein
MEQSGMHRELGHNSDISKNNVGNGISQTVGAATESGSAAPSFLVNDTDNVNAENRRVIDLLTMWEYLVRKGRTGKKFILLINNADIRKIRIMPAKCRSRYFREGRFHISSEIKKRLGRYEKVPGLMETLTYDPKIISREEAWASFGKDTRRFLNSVNQYRIRRGWRRVHYVWVVEVQEGTGYPHVHIFFPNLRFLAPVKILSSNWSEGRANVESPKKINFNCAAYISKYLRKMDGWTDFDLVFLWKGKCRMYGFSRGFSVKPETKLTEWKKLTIIRTENIEQIMKTIKEGGYYVYDDISNKRFAG